MSADNGICVTQVGRYWYVAHGFLSDDTYGTPDFVRAAWKRGQAKRYKKWGTALNAAHDLEKKIGYVEYGVTTP